MPHFTIERDNLMARYGWTRKVATLWIRRCRGIDTPEDWLAIQEGAGGYNLLSQGEFMSVTNNYVK